MFDAIIIGITLILALKGFFNGFIKEIAGLIGIIGGLFLASKFYAQAGIYINENLFAIKNASAINTVGFIAVFVGIWIFVVFLGFILSKILKIAALGVFDRIAGFIFSGAKFFLIVAVLLTLLSKVAFIKERLDNYTQNSIVYPLMLNVGEKIINLKPEEIQKELQSITPKNIETKNIADNIKETIENKVKETIKK